jgi:hypothetical protein
MSLRSRHTLPHVLLLSGVIAVVTPMMAENPAATPAATANQAKAAQDYGKLPLAFEANRGQADPSVKFLSRGAGYSLFLTGSEAVLALGRPANCKAKTDGLKSKPESCPANQNGAQQHATRQDIVQMKLAGATVRHAATATGEAELPGKVNYFIGNDPTKWHSDLPTYSKVRLSRVYPGIDLVYYGNRGQLEYDFIVAPHTDPSKITLALKGTRQLRIDAGSGDLILSTSPHQPELRLLAPVTYQTINGQRTTIPSYYKLIAGNRVRFTVGSYDRSRPLIIDPVLVYSTYLGGTGWKDYLLHYQGDQGFGIAADSAGNAYVVGSAYSGDFPVTAGAYQTVDKEATGSFENRGNGSSVFVSKLNPAGTALLYSTYIGGTGQYFLDGEGDFGFAIAVDAAGNAYVTGNTFSFDFPLTVGALQTSPPNNDESTGFVTKLDPTGSSLVYSTYLGGIVGDSSFGTAGNAIAVDSSGNAYIAGYTASPVFPVTAGAFQAQLQAAPNDGTPNAFVSKLNSSGTALIYSTYLGGSGIYVPGFFLGDQANGIAIDNAGNAFVTGLTYSPNFPVTSGAFQTVNPSAANEDASGFVTELNPTGTAEVYSTYLGGSGQYHGGVGGTTPRQTVNAIAVDKAGSAYVAGSTISTDFPTTAGALVTACEFGSGFVTKLNPSGSALVYSTCLFVGYPVYSVSGLAVDSGGDAYLTGYGTITGFQTTSDAVVQYQHVGTGNPVEGEAFLAKINPTGSALKFATLLGDGTGLGTPSGAGYSSAASAVAVNAAGKVFVTGYAGEVNFPASAGAIQATNKGAANKVTNAFVTALDLSGDTADHFLTQTALTVSAATALHGQAVTLTAKVNAAPNSSSPSSPITPTGNVTFYGYGDYGPVPSSFYVLPNKTVLLDGTGTATWTTSTLSADIYYVWAAYTGDGSHVSSNSYSNESSNYGVVNFQVFGAPTAITATSPSEPAITYGQSFAHPLTVQVKDSYGQLIPGLQVNFSGSGLTFTPASAITDTHGQVTVVARAVKAGNLVAIASVAGLSKTATWPLTVSPAPLTVSVHPAFVPRPYGSPNPAFTDTITGLVNGDTVTVTETTTATPSSPLGAYPITATVTGPAVANYTLTVVPGTLNVRPATLHIVASTVTVTYGQTPAQPTAYKLTGFVNGDTASVVSGAPVLSTTVTSTTPSGYYTIGVQVGTLKAANYVFTSVANGEGSVYVKKAPLALSANNLTMTQGGPVPTLTYTLTGFVNGQSASGTVTGTPVLTTTATSASKPGKYPITITQGSLASTNYSFTKVNGVLTVLP